VPKRLLAVQWLRSKVGGGPCAQEAAGSAMAPVPGGRRADPRAQEAAVSVMVMFQGGEKGSLNSIVRRVHGGHVFCDGQTG